MKILAADYVLPIASEPVLSGAVAVDDDKIVAVGDSSRIRKLFPEAIFQDFGEAVIIPGLVNCHTHLELTIMRGFLDDVEDDFFKWLIKIAVTRDQRLTDRDLEFSALLGTVEAARAGITCLGDIGRYGKAGFDALRRTGLRGIVYQETEFSPVNENATEDFDRLKEKFLRLKEGETDLVSAGLSPHSPYTVSRQLFELITEFSLSDRIKVSIHAAESASEEQLMTNGTGPIADFYRDRKIHWSPPRMTSIGYLSEVGVLQTRPLLAHCIRTNETDLDLLAATGSSIAHCPKSNAKFGHCVAPLEKFLDFDLDVGLGSDSVASNNTCDILEEARFAVLTARAKETKNRLISAREIIESMTIGGARALQLDEKIGTLETGKQADLTILSLTNLAQQPIHDIYSAVLFASSSRDIDLTMVAGNVVFEHGISTRVDEEDLKREVARIARRMGT